jgi:hypothetical protein
MIVMLMSNVAVVGSVASATGLRTGVGALRAVIFMPVMTMLVHGLPSPFDNVSPTRTLHANAPRERSTRTLHANAPRERERSTRTLHANALRERARERERARARSTSHTPP